MEETVGLVVAIIGLLVLIVIPILAIGAWVKVHRLERTLAGLERRLGRENATVRTHAEPGVAPPPTTTAEPALIVREPVTPAPAAAPAAPPPPPPPRDARLSPPALTPARTGFEWENLIAGRWLNRVGLTAVGIGVAYFLKHAIDNDWIGPRGQVALGILLGAGLLASAPSFVKKGLVYFADGLTGLGAAILYLSLWAGGSYYGFFSPGVTFAAMAVVTGAMLTIAMGRNSPRIAAMAMTGGFLAPWLVSTGQDAQVVLFTYLALHNSALLVLAWRRDWRFLELPAFFLTEIYFWAWYGQFYSGARLASTTAFAALFFLQFSALSVVRSRRTAALLPEQVALSLLNAFGFLLALRQMMWPGHRWALTVSTLALAVVYLAAARAVSPVPVKARQARLLFAGLALTCVTLAIPMRLDGSWIAAAWSVEAAVLMWTGFTAGVWYLRATAFVLFAMVGLRLAALPVDATEFLWNARFGLSLLTAACAGIALACAWRRQDAITERERPWFGALAVGINILLLIALTSEVDLYYSTQFLVLPSFEGRLAESLAISLLWTTYATALLTLGVRLSSALLRWQGLVLFAFTSLKVFFADLAFLRGFYRIISSIALGVVLIVISYLYQRRLAARKGVEEEA